jgi:hypothetical protein
MRTTDHLQVFGCPWGGGRDSKVTGLYLNGISSANGSRNRLGAVRGCERGRLWGPPTVPSAADAEDGMVDLWGRAASHRVLPAR